MYENIIGVVGGMGSYATAHFFRELLDSFPAEKEWERPRIIVDNNCVMPSRVRAVLYGEEKEKLINSLSAAVNGLAALGCSKIILACITSHSFLKHLKISHPENLEIIDLLAATADAAKAENEIYICCTEGTTQLRLWDRYFEPDTRLVYPSSQELAELRQFIEAVKQNKITDETVAAFSAFIEDVPCGSVILGCTELPVLYKQKKHGLKPYKKQVYDPLQCGINDLKAGLA